MIDREALYKLLAEKEWTELAKVLYHNHAQIESDPVAKQAISFFENEFFGGLANLNHDERLRAMEYPSLVLQLKRKSFTSEFRQRFVKEKLASLAALERSSALSYAVENRDVDEAAEYISRLDAECPEVLADARRETTRIRASDTKHGPPAVVSLFKSRQEENFFLAMRGAFPTYDPYPNVALSSILDFPRIEQSISREERDYFFRATVDCVVFDSNRSYHPMYFFELDSPYHDSRSAHRRDEMKDGIFSAANTKLHRIRAEKSEDASMESFRQLIVEVVRGL